MVKSSLDILSCETKSRSTDLSVYSLNRAMPMASRKVFSRVSTGFRMVMCLDITPFHRKRMMKVMITTHAKNTSRLYRNSWRLREYRMPCILYCNLRKKFIYWRSRPCGQPLSELPTRSKIYCNEILDDNSGSPCEDRRSSCLMRRSREDHRPTPVCAPTS